MTTVVWALLALDIQPILVLAFDRISMHGFSLRDGCIRCPIFACQQLSDGCRYELLPTSFV